jgi:glycyl-radical enzyme activating protein
MTGWIFNIQRYSIQDGPGIRTTVFFKGCPIRCLWCANPESQEVFPQLLYVESHCVRCYRCIEACPHMANTRASDGRIRIDQGLCKVCGKCIEVCPNEARVLCGRLMTVEEVLEEVKKDALFYWNSAGGVTASGGEPTQQPEFLIEFFKRCQDVGFHTTLDTSGYVTWERFVRILEYTDRVLYNIKHMDPVRHRELTGVDNGLILENVKKIAEREISFIVRVPLIPGCNDSAENLQDLARFVTELGKGKVDLLPYHQLGVRKYERLRRCYELDGSQLFEKEEIQAKMKVLESYSLEVKL